MKRRTFILASLLAACTPRGSLNGGGALDAWSKGPAPKASPDDIARVVGSTNRFALDALRRLRKEGGNLAFSPASIALALNMTRAGARTETAAQMAAALNIELEDARAHAAYGQLLHGWNQGGEGYELAVANRLFGEKSLAVERDFLDVTQQRYGAALEPLSFKTAPESARQRINAWIAERTRDRIEELLPEGSIKRTARLVLTNAIYFKGSWKKAFDPARTHDQTFYAPGGEKKAEMMRGKIEAKYAAADGMKLVELPYEGDDVVMTVIVPDAPDGLDAVVAQLDEAKLKAWLDRAHPDAVNVGLPRFKLAPAAPLKLKPMLSAMGMPDAFDERRADFTGIARPAEGSLFIDDAYHKAFVEVNEAGTEAAGATGVVVGVKSSVMQSASVVADRPFLFLIRDEKRGAILFAGCVEDPTA